MNTQFKQLINEAAFQLATKELGGDLVALSEKQQIELITEYIKQESVDSLIDELAEIAHHKQDLIKDLLLAVFTPNSNANQFKDVFFKRIEQQIDSELSEKVDFYRFELAHYRKYYFVNEEAA